MSTDVTKTFGVDADPALIELKRLQAEIEAVKKKLTEVHTESKIEMPETIKGVMNWAKSYTTVTGAIAIVEKAYDSLVEKSREAAERLKQDQNNIASSFGQLGLAKDFDRLERFANSNALATPELSIASLRGAMSGGRDLSRKMQEDIARNTSMMSAIYNDPSKAEGAARLTAQFGEVFGDKNSQQLFGMMQYATEATGEDATQFADRRFMSSMRSLVDSGAMTSDEALAFGVMAAKNKHLGTKFVESFSTDISGGFHVDMNKASFTDADIAKLNLQKLKPAEAAREILSNKDTLKKLYGDEAIRYGRASWGDVEEGVNKLRGLESRTMDERLGELNSTELGESAVARNQIMADKDRRNRNRGLRTERYQRLLDEYDEDTKDVPLFLKALPKAGLSSMFWAMNLFGMDPGKSDEIFNPHTDRTEKIDRTGKIMEKQTELLQQQVDLQERGSNTTTTLRGTVIHGE